MTTTDPKDQRRATYETACRMADQHPGIATPQPADFGLPADTPTPAPAPLYGYSPPPPIDLTDKQAADDTDPATGATAPNDLDGQVQQALSRMQQATKVSHTPRPKTGPTAVHFRSTPGISI